MVNLRQFGNRVIVLKFGIFLLGQIFHAAEADNKIEEIEKAILDYYKYTNGFIWKWNSREAKLLSNTWSTVVGQFDAICPSGTNTDMKEDPSTQNIMLESQSCTKVPMEVLKSRCYNDPLNINTYFQLVRGPNGEVYEVLPPKNETKCDDPETMIVKRCVDRGEFSTLLDVSEIENFFFYGHGDILKPRLPRNTQAVSGFPQESLALPEQTPSTFIGQQHWDSPESTCKLLYPNRSKIRLERLAVILESKNCAEVQMLVLKCESEESSERVEEGYVRDIDNQIYEVPTVSVPEPNARSSMFLQSKNA